MLKKYFKKESKDKSWLEEAKIEFLKSSEIELFLMENSELDIFSKVKILPNSFFLILKGRDAKNFDKSILKK